MLVGMALLAPEAQAQLLPAGKPAGVQQAAVGTTGSILLVAVGVSVVVGVLGVAMGGGISSSNTSK